MTERDRGFNFKLLMPPRVSSGQISAVRPQEIVESCGHLVNMQQQDYSKIHDKDKSVVAPTKPARPDFIKMKVVSPMEKEENTYNPGHIYSKLFDEVEKIKCWKVKVDSDTVQKDRRLQDNKRTIENQRKAIQELQFGNESLSIKLEEQISENEDLRNKNIATRNLCNVLKETFEWSAEKMHLLDSEREETHQLFLENGDSIKKLIAAFDDLRVQAEANQQEMHKVKEDLMLLENLKQKYHQDCMMKDEETAALQTTLKDKENELEKLCLHLHETEKHCRELKKSTDQQLELLKSSQAEQETLLQRLHAAELRTKETEKIQESIAAAWEQSKKEHEQIIQSKDLSLKELNRIKHQQAEKLEQIQKNIQELKNSLAQEIQRTKELEADLTTSNNDLERKNAVLGETLEQAAKKDELIKTLKDELDLKSKSFESLKVDIDASEAKVEQLSSELSKKTAEIYSLKSKAEMAFAENQTLQKTCEAAEKAQENLKEKSSSTEVKVQELEEQLISEIKKNEENTLQLEQLRKEIMQHEMEHEELLSKYSELQSERTALQQQFEKGFSNAKDIEANMKMSEKKSVKLKRETQRLEKENESLLEELNSAKAIFQQSESLQTKIEEKFEHLQEEITAKEKSIKAVETKLCNLRRKFEIKLKAQEDYKKENKLLKKQITKQTAKYSELETTIKSLQEESLNFKRLKDEDLHKLLNDLEAKSTFAAELEKEVQQLRVTTAEAIKNKEDAELKCQHKIADMVALMEKHKNQYDRIVEEKDAELDENKKKELEAVAHAKSMELDLLKQKTENDQLIKELKIEKANKANMQKELTELKQEMSVKVTQLSNRKHTQSAALNKRQEGGSETPGKSSSKSQLIDLFKTWKTPSHGNDDGITAVINKPETVESMRTPYRALKAKPRHSGAMKTPGSVTNRVGGTSKMKSYRIRTPPPAEKAAHDRKSTFELDPKSDSSDSLDLLTFTSVAPSGFSAPHCKANIFKKIQSPATSKSPRNTIKLAAMKRMREAGWTAVIGCDKKKKKTHENIFA